MNKFRFSLAMITGKTMIRLMRLMKRNATNLPGSVALSICPDMLSGFTMPENVIVVTGTNGKTTVTNMLGGILKKKGLNVITNSFGGNVNTGIANLFIDHSKLNGTVKADIALIEMDERSAPRVLPFVKPDYLLCTNLQRDSMKRNASPEFIFNLLDRNIPSKTTLILNADDLISSRLAEGNKRAYFGIDLLEDEVPTTDNLICDVKICPECGTVMEYKFKHYNHIGQAFCPECGLKNPESDFQITKSDGENVSIRHNGSEEVYPLPNNRITDIYNTAAVTAFLRTFGFSEEDVRTGLDGAEIVKSRFETFTSHGREVFITLAKGQNPVACSAAFDFVRKSEGKKAVVLIVEDACYRQQSSENIAWIYEADFEFLKGDDIEQIIVGGERCQDFLVRMLLAGIDRDKISICMSESDVASQIKWESFEKLFILYHFYNTDALLNLKKQIQEGGTK